MITQVLGEQNKWQDHQHFFSFLSDKTFTTWINLYPTCLAMLVAKPFKCGATLMHRHAMGIQVLMHVLMVIMVIPHDLNTYNPCQGRRYKLM